MIGSSISPRNENFRQVIQSYYQLTKPRIIPLLLITTAASMFMASEGNIDPILLIITLLGGTLAAASAQTFNCVYDQDIDYDMKRTRKRPIPSGKVQSNHAIIFGAILGILSFSLLAIWVNLLSALLAMSGIIFYMLIYTHWLKRHTTQNIVIGGAAGAIPPLVGWAAVTGDLSWSAWAIFMLIFLWTPPHFWALALMISDDYAEVGVPMLPVVEGASYTVKQIWIYTLITVGFSFILIYPLHSLGLVYFGFATILGITFIVKAWQLLQQPEDKETAKSMFKYSILYMMLLCTGIVIDTLPNINQYTIF
ncbi:MAG: protoheme IX farnesyltransferase [Cyanobacteria bacterium]|nr:protoheme IX farnesyltransferase [Cyanobacteria bacterium CG_2015-16_32_12]NCO78462.1 protoheme IX farnesyltransferase [Cyanobacteria bacterium CG_2015-22_32_23]NCQ04078.1 protoheme IX farnesyltransferase [Cyanobacteria bacterium CG_2015-09_32_10]NCQ42760.1 protoheme IX farnesyltransferase [Cyanobacteria bacterium CG_2015-04_32_10]NCS83535.1 protoheme IX farnesyltransferase [Cyanobacteria bacterium CG_2015-02_32_10]